MPEYVLPLVVRIERDRPPQRTDAIEAAARAVLSALAAADPLWQQAVARWEAGSIAKVVRRARGAQWRHALEGGGLQIEHRSAQVLVFAPIPSDEWPPMLARLQVRGTELADTAAASAPSAGEPLIVLSPHVRMTAGKAMAQAGHAAHLGWRASERRQREAWAAAGLPVAVRRASLAQWADALRHGAPVVHDGGRTELAPGTATAAAVLPWLAARVDEPPRQRSDS